MAERIKERLVKTGQRGEGSESEGKTGMGEVGKNLNLGGG